MRPCNMVLLALVGLLLAGCGQTRLLPKPTPTPSMRLTKFPVPTGHNGPYGVLELGGDHGRTRWQSLVYRG